MLTPRITVVGAGFAGLTALRTLRRAARDAELTLVAPEAALSPSGETQYVYRVRDGVAERREVTIGERREGRVEILTGVAAGDQLVVSGLQRVTDGAAVTVLGNGA